MKEKKDRCDDALHATRAALEEGIVAGGGTAYLRCLDALSKVEATGDESVGVQIVGRALESPVRQIAANAGRLGMAPPSAFPRPVERVRDLPRIHHDPAATRRCAAQARATGRGGLIS
jgi:hypothetical protein